MTVPVAPTSNVVGTALTETPVSTTSGVVVVDVVAADVVAADVVVLAGTEVAAVGVVGEPPQDTANKATALTDRNTPPSETKPLSISAPRRAQTDRNA